MRGGTGTWGGWFVGVAALVGCNGLAFSVRSDPVEDTDMDGGVEASADGDADGSDGGEGACAEIFSEPDAGCSASDDCAFFFHAVDCCGTERAYGVRRDQQAEAYAAELLWATRCVTCRCAPGPTSVEVDGGTCKTESIAARCTEGRCESYCR